VSVGGDQKWGKKLKRLATRGMA